MRSGYFFIPLLIFAANYYLYTWLVRLCSPSPPVRKGILLGILILVASFPVGKILGRDDFNTSIHLLTLVSSSWLGFSFLVIIAALGSDLIRLLLRLIRFPLGLSPLKIFFYRRLLAGILCLAALGMGGYAFWEAQNIRVTQIEIPLRKLPAALDRFTLVQISDVHYGMLIENGRLTHIVHRVNELHPDLVVITGDLVDEGVSHMEEMAVPLAGLKARLGVLAVMGNHEFFAGVERAESILRQAGIRVLRNESILLPGGLQILGIDDPTVLKMRGLPTPDFEGPLSSLDPEGPSILLYHQPRQFEKAASAGVGLQLSGHTHGPQFFILYPFVRLIYPRYRGLFQLGESYLYVSRGAGTGGPPMRLGSPPELVHICLRSPKKQGVPKVED